MSVAGKMQRVLLSEEKIWAEVWLRGRELTGLELSGAPAAHPGVRQHRYAQHRSVAHRVGFAPRYVERQRT
jgi:hypothetical protein